MFSREFGFDLLTKFKRQGEGIYANKPLKCDITIDMSSDAPLGRSGHRIVCDEHNFYSYGGYNPSIDSGEEPQRNEVRFLLADVLKYNFMSKKWTKLHVNNIPFTLVSNVVILSGKILMVYGGTGLPFIGSKSHHLYVCNLADSYMRFEKIITTGKKPPRLYGQAAFLRDHYLYTMGGTNGHGYTIDIHRLNLNTSVWEEVYICKGLRNEPHSRYRHDLAVVGNNVYLLGGGRDGRESYGYEEIHFFDLTNSEWEVVEAIGDGVHGYPPARLHNSTVRIPGTNKFIIIGGITLSGRILDDTWRLDIDTMQWHHMGLRLFTPVFFHSSCITPAGKMYTFGGISNHISTLQERINHVQSAWVIVPKLKDMCWEAVTEYKLIKEHDI